MWFISYQSNKDRIALENKMELEQLSKLHELNFDKVCYELEQLKPKPKHAPIPVLPKAQTPLVQMEQPGGGNLLYGVIGLVMVSLIIINIICFSIMLLLLSLAALVLLVSPLIKSNWDSHHKTTSKTYTPGFFPVIQATSTSISENDWVVEDQALLTMNL